jgi:hypothetical protein
MVPSAALTALANDLRAIFSDRLQSLVAYAVAESPGASAGATLAIVHRITAADLRACADRITDWHNEGLATPLLLEAHEFARSLDAFPYEFGAILADHVVISGSNPFDGLRVETHDLRRACEVQARSHLLHFREGCIETAGRSDALADLIMASAAPLAALLKSVVRLDPSFIVEPGLARVVNLAGRPRVSSDEAKQLLPDYLTALEHLVHHIDQWRTT